AMKMTEHGPDAMILFFPASQAQIHENWNVLGMRGTGSHDFEAKDIFVPDNHVWHFGPFTPNAAFPSALSRVSTQLPAPMQAVVALGIARSAVEDLIALAGSKTPSYTQTGLADRPVVQDKIARARAAVEAGRAYILAALAEAEATLATAPRLT